LAKNSHCTRCGATLHQRKTNSIERTWALLIAAYALYVPANLLPIMETRSLFSVQRDTILSGVAFLWNSGSWILALIVFVASVAVPVLKLFSMTLLVVSVQIRNTMPPLPRARLYRLLELIGRWSMLDVYVVAILVALVQAQSLATMAPGPGVLAFGAVVVLSMLATMAFDPRLIWDTANQTENNVKVSTDANQSAT
jgi:paraquat-inducible protein A